MPEVSEEYNLHLGDFDITSKVEPDFYRDNTGISTRIGNSDRVSLINLNAVPNERMAREAIITQQLAHIKDILMETCP